MQNDCLPTGSVLEGTPESRAPECTGTVKVLLCEFAFGCYTTPEY